MVFCVVTYSGKKKNRTRKEIVNWNLQYLYLDQTIHCPNFFSHQILGSEEVEGEEQLAPENSAFDGFGLAGKKNF